MADDTQFSALLDSLLAFDNDTRTQAEVNIGPINRVIGEKSIKWESPRKKCASGTKKKKLIRDDDESCDSDPLPLQSEHASLLSVDDDDNDSSATDIQ